jgi:sugar lactone lactonase YvrE
MKKVSILLVVTMLFSMFQFTGSLAYADIDYSGVVIASGMSSTMGIVLGPDDKLYVSDYSGNKIIKMDKDGSNLTTLTTNIFQPVGITFDKSGNLIVAEHNRGKITKVDASGSTTLIKDGLGYVTGVAVDSNDKIFVVSYTTGKIYKMDADGSNSSVFTTIMKGSSPVTSSLIGMGIDASDNLYVSDRANSRIIKIDPSGNQSDFASVPLPYWASVGKDGYVYASAGNKTIQKYDLSGNIVETFSTGTFSPWGTQVDTGGGIYFVYSGSTVNRILGYGETVDRTHIKITLFYNMVSGAADASAFTLTGVASNPQVTSAVVNGSEIVLTLDDNIEFTDTSVKVTYNKTGTSNLALQGSSVDVDSFSNLAINNSIIGVASVGSLSALNVAYGTALSDVGLPETVAVNLSNSTTSSADVVWDGGTPSYDANISGTYTFKGTLSLAADIYNPSNKQATVTVNVAENPVVNITSVSSLQVINVPNGTDLSDVGLPGTVSVDLSNSTTSSALVVWDGGTPPYDGDTAGTYTFKGTLSPSADIYNPDNKQATVTVAVAEKPVVNITSVSSLQVINVPNGTDLSDVGLPGTVSVDLSNSTTSSALVVWDGGTPPYDGDTAGTYTFKGTLSPSADIYNPDNKQATVTVAVAESTAVNITSVSSLKVISVANGTTLSNVGLPVTVTVTLSNSTTSSALVVWDGGTPPYDGDTAGTYTFSGTLPATAAYVNLNHLKAEVNVVVKAATSLPNKNASKPKNASDDAVVEVNGVQQKVASEKRVIDNGKSIVKIVVNQTSMKAIMDDLQKNTALGNENTNLVEVKIQDTTGATTNVELDGEIVKQLEEGEFSVRINRGERTYEIPAKELGVDEIAKKLSVAPDELKSIKFQIELEELADEEEAKIVEQFDGSRKLLTSPIKFNISAVVFRNDGTSETVVIDSFKNYVTRGFELPSDTVLTETLTGVVFDDRYEYYHVPTTFKWVNGKLYAEIHSLTNSVYTVIDNQAKVNSVENHWSKEIVNDMACSMVLTDYGQFDPDENITRGDLATYMIKALGLYRDSVDLELGFSDVDWDDKNAESIALANQWEIISGYSDGTFKPNSKVTREEAMVMFSKAMEVVNYEGIPGASEIEIESDSSLSQWSKVSVQKVIDGFIFNGRANRALALENHLTHAEALSALNNLLIKSGLIN